MLKAEELIASTQNVDSHLGYLFWFSIGSQMNRVDDLRQKLINSGLSEEWMPRRIRAVDAFRRATREVQRKKPTSNPKVFENYLVREVFSDDKFVQRNVVIEQVNQNDKKLGYETEVGIIRLDKEHSDLYIQAEDSEIIELCKDAKNKFNLYRNHYTSQHIRVMVNKILNSLAPTPMRENGIIYFIPRSMDKGLRNLVQFIRSLENSDAFQVPVIDSNDNRYMVNKRLSEHLDNLLTQCRDSEGLRKDQIKNLVSETNKAIKDFNEYRTLTNAEKEHYENKIIHLRAEVMRILED